MIKIDNLEYRNLVEQVAENQKQIQNLLMGAATIGEFGLIVINVSEDGTVPTVEPDLLPGDDVKFGYSWLVRQNPGVTPPSYHIYIWTRLEFDATAGWVDAGEFPKQGPQGVQGEQGLQGPQGVSYLWRNGTTAPASTLGVVGDWYIDTTTYNIYTKTSPVAWALKGNIKGNTGPQGIQGLQGPQGIQGIQGETGATGPQGDTGPQGAKGNDGTSVQIQDGVYSAVNPLPPFASTTEGKAYVFLDSGNMYDLYIHGFGGTDWTIIDNWVNTSSSAQLPFVDVKLDASNFGNNQVSVTFPSGLPNFNFNDYQSGCMTVIGKVLPTSATLPTGTTAQSKWNYTGQSYATAWAVNYEIYINGVSTANAITDPIYVKPNDCIFITFKNAPEDTTRIVNIQLPHLKNMPNPATVGNGCLPYYGTNVIGVATSLDVKNLEYSASHAGMIPVVTLQPGFTDRYMLSWKLQSGDSDKLGGQLPSYYAQNESYAVCIEGLNIIVTSFNRITKQGRMINVEFQGMMDIPLTENETLCFIPWEYTPSLQDFVGGTVIDGTTNKLIGSLWIDTNSQEVDGAPVYIRYLTGVSALLANRPFKLDLRYSLG